MKNPSTMQVSFKLNHPLWYGAFRPFFIMSAMYSIIALLLWPFVYYHNWQIPGQLLLLGNVQWHAYQMVYGFVLAALAGFILTAIPEFTETSFLSRQNTFYMATFWLISRIAFYVPGSIGTVMLAIADVGLVFQLSIFTMGRLNRIAWKKHNDLVMGLLLLLISVSGYHFSVLRGEYSLQWVRLTVGIWMILIIMAMSRISMRIVNDVLENRKVDVKYLARPPRKHFAIMCLLLYSTVEFLGQSQALRGWLALAASAAIFNLLNDWHVHKAILSKWILMLYSIYAMLALGYGIIGLSALLDLSVAYQSAGRHVLVIGGIGTAIFMVFAIAGRAHSGYKLDERRWVPVGVSMMLLCAITRFLWAKTGSLGMFWLSILIWVTVFSLNIFYMLPILLSVRPDGKTDASGRDDEVLSCSEKIQ